MQNDTLVSEDHFTSGAAAAFPESERVYAGFFVRLAAYLIDWIIVGAALLVIKIPVWISWIMNGTGFLTQDFIFKYSIYDMVIYVLKVLYFVLLTYYSGATLGKKLMNLEVVSEEDRKPTLFEIAYRESVGKFLSGLIMSVGYIIIGLDKRKRGLHDQLADTCVVYCHKKTVYVAAPVMTQQKPFISTQLSPQNPQGANVQAPLQNAQGSNMPGTAMQEDWKQEE
ncbi:MAG: RDD family protein [Lachnospiraceae bacterium]|nr:RDD family protein [Lachnospiraceae bacterium]